MTRIRFSMHTALRGAGVLTLAIAAGLMPAKTQPASAAEASQMEEIVVTAEFRERSLQRTPIAITAVSGEMLEARSQTEITDVTAQAPNVQLQVNPAGGGNSMRAFIRGVGQADQSPAVDPGVGIYVDDIYFASVTGSVFDLVDVERIEILRGPQGTLSGMNSLGGSVKIFSRKPEGEGGYVIGTYGRYDRTDIRASGDFTLIPDQLYMRISGTSRHRDGYITRLDYACVHPDDPYVVSGAIPKTTSRTDCKIGTQGGQSMSALRGIVRWMPSDKLEVTFIADGTHDTSETQAHVLLDTGEIIPGLALSYQGFPYDDRFVPFGSERGDTVINDPYINYATFTSPGLTYTPIDTAGTPGTPNGPYSVKPANEIRAWGFSGSVDWQVTDTISIKSITGYRGYKTLSGQDNDASPSVQLQSLSNFTHDQFSQEIRLSGVALDNLVEYTVGGIYFRQETVYETREHDPFIPLGTDPFNRPIFDFIQDDTTVNKTKAVFAHAIWMPTDQLNIATGIRYTKQDKNYTFFRLNVDGQTPFLPLSDPANPLNGRTGTFSGDHVDYRVNVSYQWTPDIMTYIQFSTGFKGGGISPRPYFPEQILGFGTEELYAYEAGFKSRFLDQRLQLNTAIFYNDYKDYQATPTECVDEDGNILPPPFNTPCGQYQNVADAEVKGIEAEMVLYPVDALRIDGSISYLDFEFQEPFIETNAVIEGTSAPGIGDLKWSFGIQYDFDFIGGGSLSPRLDVYHTPGYCGNLDCDPLVSNTSYNLVNGRITYRSGDDVWSLAVEVTNLTDKLYYLNKFTSTYTGAQPGPPRQWAISARRNF